MNVENSRGYILIHRDWYEAPDEADMLRRNAVISTLNPNAFKFSSDAQIVRRGYAVLEPPNTLPFAYTICDCVPVDESPFDTLDDAHDYLREHGVKHPRVGFNPIG